MTKLQAKAIAAVLRSALSWYDHATEGELADYTVSGEIASLKANIIAATQQA